MANNIDFKFEEAPRVKRTGRPVDPEELKIAKTLRENPGREARVFDFRGAAHRAGGVAQQINKGERAAFKDGFSAVSRSGVVYVTYVGGENVNDTE